MACMWCDASQLGGASGTKWSKQAEIGSFFSFAGHAGKAAAVDDCGLQADGIATCEKHAGGGACRSNVETVC